MSKILGVLQSRKFWVSVIGVLVAVGLLELSDAQQADLVAAIVTISGSIGYVLSVAIEDGLSRRGEP